MTTSPGAAIDALETHLDAIKNGGAPDEGLLRIVKPRIRYFTEEDRKSLALKIWSLLATVEPEQSPPLISFLQDLVEGISLSWILDMNIDLKPGLDLMATSYHELVLELLDTADQDSARRLATNHRELFEELVKLWLLVPKIGTGEKASNVFLHLLEVDKEGSVVKRLFRDKDIYESIYTICDEKTRPAGVSKIRQSAAQTRLLSWLAELAKTHWNLLNESYHPEVETAHGVPADKGLLEFAALYLMRDRSDIVLFSVLIQFYTDIVAIKQESGEPMEKPVGLEFLQICGAHKAMIDMFCKDPQPDDDDLDFIYSDLALYIIRYSTFLPHRLIENETDVLSIVERLKSGLGPSNVNWTYPDKYVINHLKVLANLPRTIILNNYDLLQLLQTGHSNPYVVTALMGVFHGPNTDIQGTRDLSASHAAESNLARKLFERYLSECPRLFQNLAKNASDTAQAEEALVSLEFIDRIIRAPWDSGPLLLCGQRPPKYQDFLKLLLEAPSRTAVTSVEPDQPATLVAEKKYLTAKGLLELMRKYVNQPGNLVSVRDHVALQDRVSGGVFGRLPGAMATVATLSR